MNQTFSPQQLIKLCKKREWEFYGLTKAQLSEQLTGKFDLILNKKFEFAIQQTGNYYQVNDLAQKLVLRKLNDNIKRIYKDEQSNRRIIIRQIKALLSETVPMWLLKTDIEEFYESVGRDRLLSKLRNDSMLSYHSIILLEKLFASPELSGNNGLPRGLNISSTLSEMYMRKFDKWVQRNPSVYYYARFVDDIVIFSSNKKELENLNKKIDTELAEIGLKKKNSKTAIYDGSNIPANNPFEYLGYRFTTKIITTEKKKQKKLLEVSIARKKIKKIKTRIVSSFMDYHKTRDFDLLENRVKFLSGNYSIKKNEEGEDLKAGIFYNYCYITKHDDLHNLNSFYRKLLHCKSKSLGLRISASLSLAQRTRLSKYSFVYGHTNQVYTSFSIDQMREIKKCW